MQDLGNRRISHYLILKPKRMYYEIEYTIFSEITYMSLGFGNELPEKCPWVIGF